MTWDMIRWVRPELFYAEAVNGSRRCRALVGLGRTKHYTGILNKLAALPPRMATRSASLNPGVPRT